LSALLGNRRDPSGQRPTTASQRVSGRRNRIRNVNASVVPPACSTEHYAMAGTLAVPFVCVIPIGARIPAFADSQRNPMRLYQAAVLIILIAPECVSAQNLGTYDDRIAVEDVMARYVWAVDSLDADGYVAVFTEDAVIDSNGSISKGHSEIREVVTGLIRRRDENKAKGLPTGNLYHVISNVRIVFPKPGEAVHYSYWQTVRRDKDGRMTAAAMGRSEDRLVKRNGKWLIQWRTLTVFTD
jgi:uncharacterized protein (TIGR02246 family)